MRLLIVVENIPPYCGGAEQVAWMHALAFAKEHDVFVITFGEREHEERRDEITIVYLKKPKRLLLYYIWKGYRALNDRIDKIKPDVVHCHMPNVLSLFVSRKYTLFSTVHDGVPEDKARQLNNLTFSVWAKNWLIRKRNIMRSNCITCVSRHNFEFMRERYRKKQACFEVVVNPVNEDYFSPVSSEEGTYVLNFGRQISLKMVTLIETARIMPELDFKFLGTGPMVGDYGLKNIEFVGFSSNVKKWIDGAQICVFPSKSENFPLVGLEAMARGKPVVATKMGFSEYIEHNKNGILIDDNDPETIKAGIERLLSDKTFMRQISINARAEAEKYQPKQIFKEYNKLYMMHLGRSKETVALNSHG